MIKSRRVTPLNDQTWTQASEWLLRFNEDEIDSEAREQFNSWLRNSPENVHAYLQVCAFWREADQLGRQGDGSRDVDVLIARAKQEANVYSLGNTPFEKRSPLGAWRRKGYWASAASLLLVAGVGAVTGYVQLRDPVYRTGIGEQRILNLSDGSTATLNADSRLKVKFSEAERRLELRQGQALFKVAKNAARPFVVDSGEISVRAVGTQFDVYRKKAGTVVTVVEGKVAVTSAPLPNVGDVLVTAGQQMTISPMAHRAPSSMKSPPPPPVIHPVKLQDAIAWTEGLLVFEAAPLEEVVREFNRQNAKPLVLEGNAFATVRITGSFPANGSERITRFLQDRHGVVIHETDDEIRISRR